MFPQIQHRETDKDYSVKTPSASENAFDAFKEATAWLDQSIPFHINHNIYDDHL